MRNPDRGGSSFGLVAQVRRRPVAVPRHHLGEQDEVAPSLIADGRSGFAPLTDSRPPDRRSPGGFPLAPAIEEHRHDFAHRRAPSAPFRLFGVAVLEAERERYGRPARPRLAPIAT